MNITKAEKTKLYNRTKVGLARRLYNHQIERCKTRNHEMPSYTRIEFQNWLHSHKDFEKLYNNWVKSGYLKEEKPSVDRLDDYKSYTFDNIQLITWKENNKKAREDTKIGKLHKATRQIDQFDIDGTFIKTYMSIAIASRETNSNPKAISECLSGRAKTSNKFIWKYKNDK